MIDRVLEKLEELESKLKELRATTIELQAQIFELQKCEDPPDSLKVMEYELRFWQDQRGLPHTSADEVNLDKLSTCDVDWLDQFIERWDYHANRYDA